MIFYIFNITKFLNIFKEAIIHKKTAKEPLSLIIGLFWFDWDSGPTSSLTL